MPKSFSYQRIVNFYDTDSAKIAHFSNFFRYVEEAEYELLRSLPDNAYDKEVWFRNNFSCDFYKPIKFDDQCTIELSVREIHDQYIAYDFHIHLNEQSVAKGSYESHCMSLDQHSQQLTAKTMDSHFTHLMTG